MSRDSSPDDLTGAEDTDSEFAAFERQVAHVSYVRPGPPLPRVGQVIAGKYRVDSLLGRGGMGAVFSVTHQLTQRLFAIKWLLPNLAEEPDAVQRFWREARAAGKIMHPNVVQVYDIGQEGDAHYILMELIHGVTLSDRQRQRGRFEPVEACRVLIPVMRGLHAAHLAGVVHRDLKPQNIMLATNAQPNAEVPKVLDFGISKIISHAGETHSSATRRGAIIGTPHYMPLEQLRSAQVDARTDVYALGVIAYHMLSGALPFASTNHADLVCQILGREAQPLDARVPGLPRALVDVINKAMAPDPAERFPSMAALARALEPFADGMIFAPTGESEFTPVVRQPLALHEESQEPITSGGHTPLVAESQHFRRLGSSKLSKRLQRALVIAAISVAAPALVIIGYKAAAHRRDEDGATAPVSPDHAASARSVSAASAARVVAPRAVAAPRAAVDDTLPAEDALRPTQPASRPASTLALAPDDQAQLGKTAQHAPEAATQLPMTADGQAPAVAQERSAPATAARANSAGNTTRANARPSLGQANRAARVAGRRRAAPGQDKPLSHEPTPHGTSVTPEIHGVDFH